MNELKTHEKMAAQRELESKEVTEVLNFLKKYGHIIGIVVGLLVLAYGAISFKNAKKAQQNATAGQLLMVAGTDAQLETIATNFANTPSAPAAVLALARSAYNDGEFDKAQEQYTNFLAKYANNEMAYIANYGQAACLEAQNKIDEAIAAYQVVADENAESFIAPIALFRKAKLLEAQGKTGDAIATFETVIETDETGAWGNQAETALLKLR